MQQSRMSRMGQIKVYVGKWFRLFLNERGYKNLISSAIIAIIIAWVAGSDAFVTFKATRSGAFALVCACIWMGIFNSIQAICRERDIIKREHRTGLHISSYVASHLIYGAALCLAEALITTIVLFIFRDVPTMGLLLPSAIELFITFFLVIYSSHALGMVVSSIVKTPTAAMTVMPFVLIFQLVLSGIIFELEGAAKFLANFTVSKWGVNAICIIVDVNNMQGALFVEQAQKTDFEHTFGNLWMAWFLLAIYTVLYGIICVISLKFIDKDKR